MGRITFTNSTFGSRILETITDGLYDGNVNCLREYVQNSVDAKAENVRIYFENGNQDLIIEDDGCGMSSKKLEDEALRIGKSSKNGGDVGWRGIGIWSGISASEKMVIITKAKNHKPIRIEIDSNHIRDQSRSNRDAIEILNEAVGEWEELPLGKNESLEDDHYTIIRLESILYPQRVFFTEYKIEEFLSKTIPAPFNPEVFTYAKEIERLLIQHNVVLPSINVEFQGKKIFRPPYKSDIFSNALTSKLFYVDNQLVAIGWFLTAKTNDQYKWPDAGVLFKKKGFTIGDETLFRSYYVDTYSRWQYGEIHILSDEIRENAPRSRFEYNSGIVHKFLESIETFFRELQTLNRFKSAKLPVRKLQKAEQAINKGEIAVAQRAIDEAKKSITSIRNPPPDDSFKNISSNIESESSKCQSTILGLEKAIEKVRKGSRSEQIRLKREHSAATIQRCKPAIRRQIQKLTKKPLGKLEINAMDPIRDLLKTKMNSKENDFKKLSQEAFGWGGITPSTIDPKLTIDSSLNSDDNKNTWKIRMNHNYHFGVLLYALQDLLVNLPKHEEGQKSFEWWESVSEEEKYDIVDEIALTCNLVYRLIESAEKFTPPKPKS